MNNPIKIENGILVKTVYFTDKQGYQYKLFPSTHKHIKSVHCIDDPLAFIRYVFENTFAIFESKQKREVYLYYADHKNIYRVVVADIVDRVIKTAYNSKKIKTGSILWIDKSKALKLN